MPWLALPKLEGVKWVYANDWWDYFLSGVVLYNSNRYYAYCGDEDVRHNSKWFRRYVVVELPPEAWAEEDERHAFFVEKVGSHFEFDVETQKRKYVGEGLKPNTTWHEYYDKYPPSTALEHERTDYTRFPAIGWFEK